MPVTGFLHLADIRPPYALEGTSRANDCEVEVKKGIHLTAYVKDVFPNAGRMTLSLDPNINKDKVGGRQVQRAICTEVFEGVAPRGSSSESGGRSGRPPRNSQFWWWLRMAQHGQSRDATRRRRGSF